MTHRALRGLLASAAAFVPELRPLVAKAIESPLTLPLEETSARRPPSPAFTPSGRCSRSAARASGWRGGWRRDDLTRPLGSGVKMARQQS